MEAFRQKRSKICIADRCSGGRALREGSRRIQEQSGAIFASDSSSCSSGITDEDSHMLDLGWRSSKKAAGTPMKKLLAKEMSQDTEYRRRSQGVIARLMGLEGPPPQQPAQRQQKRPSEEHRLTTKVEKAERSSPFSSRRSSRRTSKEEQEFKDVFEVVETARFERSGCRSLGTGKSNITEDEMAFIRQKFMEAKRLSTDDKLQDSKEFHDTLEVLDSNRDLLLKFLQQPDSLFTKHLHDLHGAPMQSRCNRITSKKPSYPLEYETKSAGQKSRREKIARNCGRSSQKHRSSSSCHSFSSPSTLQEKGESDVLPTRIVVLKPNLGKTRESARCSSPTSHALFSDSSSHKEYPSFRCKDRESLGKEKWLDNLDLNFKSNGSREMAKEITMRMKNAYDSGSVNTITLNSRGCAGYESSSTVSLNDSVDESDITILTSTKSFDWDHQRKPSYFSGESSVGREAEAIRRLSRRWKMAHKSQEIGVVSRGSTLADMLALTDRDVRQPKLESHCVQQEPCENFASNYGSSAVVEPLGISSRDGWKDVFVKGLSRSRSVPTSSDFLGSPKTNLRLEAPRNCRYTVPQEVMKWEKNKKVRGHIDLTDSLAPRKLKSRYERQSIHFTRGESSNASPEIQLRQNQAKLGFKEKGLSPKSPAVSEASAIAPENTVELEHDDMSSSSETTHLGLCAPIRAEPSGRDLDDPASKELPDQSSKEIRDSLIRGEPELESPASSKDADQPSPVSTLEAPFTDDISSGSECFESLSADLHGLRMQLQLLKLESQAYYSEGQNSSDEDAGEIGISSHKPYNRADESWEYSFISDVLANSGYNHPVPDMFMAKLHSLECPINPLLFEQLEKRYDSADASSRPERRLLFDRINSGVAEIYQQLSYPHPWVGSLTPQPVARWDQLALMDGLQRSLVSRERKAGKGAAADALTSETNWLKLGDDIDLIGREIERLVMDDMMAEVVVIM